MGGRGRACGNAADAPAVARDDAQLELARAVAPAQERERAVRHRVGHALQRGRPRRRRRRFLAAAHRHRARARALQRCLRGLLKRRQATHSLSTVATNPCSGCPGRSQINALAAHQV